MFMPSKIITRFSIQSIYPLIPVFILVIALAIGAAAVYSPWVVLTAVLLITATIAMLLKADVATIAVAFILYANVAVVAVKFHDVPFVIGAAFPLLLLLPLIYHIIFRRERIILSPAFPFILSFLMVQLISTAHSVDPPTAFQILVEMLSEGVLVYFLFVNVIRTKQTLRRVIWTVLVAGTIMGALTTYQQVTGTFDNNFGGMAQVADGSFRTGEENLQGEERQSRLMGPIGEQNRYAQVMLLLVPMGMFLFLGERKQHLKWLALGTTLLSASGVVLTFSRGAAVAFVLLLFIMVVIRLIKWYQLAGVLLAVFLLFTILPQYQTRLLSIQGVSGLFSDDSTTTEEPDGAIKGRTTAMIAAFRIFADNPIIGVGPGMTKFFTQEYGNDLGIRILTENREAHNLFLAIASDYGAVGFAIFFGMVGITLYRLHRNRLRLLQTDPAMGYLVTGIMLSLYAYLFTGFFLHFAYIRYFWFLMALANAAIVLIEAELKPRPFLQSTPPSSSEPSLLGGSS